MLEVEAMFVRTASASVEQLTKLSKTYSDFKEACPGEEAAYQGVFSAVIASGRLDAVIDCQDRIYDIAAKKIDERISNVGNDGSFTTVTGQALTALYMRDWIGRQISDEEFEKFNEPPLFIITNRIFTEADYKLLVAPWETVFGQVHPGD